MKLKINNVVSFKVEGRDLFVLKEFESHSQLLRMSADSKIIWSCKIPKSYDFLIRSNLIYVTTRDSLRTFVLNKKNGSDLNELSNLVLHLPVSFQSDKWVVSYATHNETKVGILLDSEMKVISALNPDSLKVTKVINKDYFLSFNKGTLTLVEFLSSNAVWSLNIFQEVENRSDDEKIKLRFLGSLVLDRVIVVSVFNTRSNNQYLFGLDKNTGKVNWYKESVMNFGGVEKKLFGLERKGELKIFDVETGVLLRTKDLSKSFKEKNINCGRGLKIEENNLLFKDEEQKKLGIIDLDSLDLKFVQDYPKDVDLSPNEYPQIIGERMILHAPLAKELHLVGLELQPA